MILTIYADRRTLINGFYDPVTALVNSFYENDALNITCSFAEKNCDNTYTSSMTYASGAVNISLGTPSILSSSLLSNSTLKFSAVNNNYTGSFYLTGSAVSTYLAGDISKPTVFSIQFSNADIIYTAYQESVILFADLIK